MCSNESEPGCRRKRVPSGIEPVMWFVLGLFFSAALFVLYAYATMVNGDMPDHERYREILRRFLFESVFQFCLVVGVAMSAVVCFSFAAVLARDVILGVRNYSGGLTDVKAVFIVLLLFIAAVVLMVAYA